jgi:crotonobetainyl-CoA:carnitine CoA-transferase CaiB-like acyl-CoA transferase
MTTSHAPLNGVVVISVEQAISASYASRHLAELGATVIKVERPEGDFARDYDHIINGQASFFVWANRGKQSIVLNLKDTDDLARFHALVKGADVVIQNLAPAAGKRLGINGSTLREVTPSLITCDISGYGNDGPRSNDRAYDLAIQAEAGIFSVTGNGNMSKAGISIADISAGMYALTSILAALVRRDRTGEGAHINVAMIDTVAEWVAPAMYGTVYSGEQPARAGRRHHSIAPYGTFTLSDNSTILIAVQNDREWQRLASHVLNDPALATDVELATNTGRIAHVERLEHSMNVILAERNAGLIRELLAKHDITSANVNDLDAVWNHEQLRARDRFETISLPEGTAEVLKSPFHISNWDNATTGVPALNEHEDETIAHIIARGESR